MVLKETTNEPNLNSKCFRPWNTNIAPVVLTLRAGNTSCPGLLSGGVLQDALKS